MLWIGETSVVARGVMGDLGSRPRGPDAHSRSAGSVATSSRSPAGIDLTVGNVAPAGDASRRAGRDHPRRSDPDRESDSPVAHDRSGASRHRRPSLPSSPIARAGRMATLDALGIDEVDGEVGGGAPGAWIDRADRRPSPRRDAARAPLLAEPHRRRPEDLVHAPRRADRAQRARPQGQGPRRTEIAACAAELGDDVDAIAAWLEVSPRGLRLRRKQLGLPCELTGSRGSLGRIDRASRL